ncbi:MAG: hypothetical protein AB1721_02885 [Patescibacteria group bacterium]
MFNVFRKQAETPRIQELGIEIDLDKVLEAIKNVGPIEIQPGTGLYNFLQIFRGAILDYPRWMEIPNNPGNIFLRYLNYITNNRLGKRLKQMLENNEDPETVSQELGEDKEILSAIAQFNAEYKKFMEVGKRKYEEDLLKI